MTRRRRRKQRVFISFDYDNDKILRDFLVGQSKLPNSPFEISDWSMKEAAPERKWKKKAAQRIRRSDKVVVISGKKTHRSPGVAAEIRMARGMGKPVIQLRGHKGKKCPRVPKGGRRFKWTWENLENQLG